MGFSGLGAQGVAKLPHWYVGKGTPAEIKELVQKRGKKYKNNLAENHQP
jgi:hypothetical protein